MKQCESRPCGLEPQYAAVLESLPDALVLVDEDSRCAYANLQAESQLGKPRHKLLGRPLTDLFDGETGASIVQHYECAVSEQSPVTFEVASQIGSNGWWEMRIYPSDGGMAVYFRDVTRHKQAEEALHRGEARFRATFEQAAVAITHAALDGRWLRINRKFCQMMGFDEEESLNYTFLDFTHPDDRQGTLDHVRRMLAGECSSFTMEKRYVRKDGSIMWGNLTGTLVRKPDGEPDYLVGVIEDITERKYTELELQRRTRSLRLLADTAIRLLMEEKPETLMGVIFDEMAGHLELEVYLNYLVTDDGQRLRLNASGGISDAERREIEYLEFGQSICGTVAQERTACVVEDVQKTDSPGTSVPRNLGVAAYACHPLVAHGRTIGTLSFGSRSRTCFSPEELRLMRAISDQLAMALERRRLMRELEHRASELDLANSAKDRFLAVLSHELRTPLTPAAILAASLENSPQLSSQLREDLATIRRNIDLEIRLIDDLLDLSRIINNKLSLDTRAVALQPLLTNVLEIVDSDVRDKQLRIRWEIYTTHDRVQGDPARLQQVLWNLIKNAIKFTPEGGTVTLRLTNPQSDRVRVQVTDSGAGIDSTLLSRVFDAFEQGKPGSKQFGGLGLGLAISKAIVDLHGGNIAAHSEGPGRGATFSVELPTTREAERGDELRGNLSGEAEEKPCRVLLVEDHVDTLRVMRRLLERTGCSVTTASTVAAASALLARESFDILVSDVGLPDGTGIDLMRQVKSRGLSLPGIAVSGFGMEQDVIRCLDAGFSAHLTKPIQLDRLTALIHQLA